MISFATRRGAVRGVPQLTLRAICSRLGGTLSGITPYTGRKPGSRLV